MLHTFQVATVQYCVQIISLSVNTLLSNNSYDSFIRSTKCNCIVNYVGRVGANSRSWRGFASGVASITADCNVSVTPVTMIVMSQIEMFSIKHHMLDVCISRHGSILFKRFTPFFGQLSQLTRAWPESQPNAIDWGGGRITPPQANSQTNDRSETGEAALERSRRDGSKARLKVFLKRSRVRSRSGQRSKLSVSAIWSSEPPTRHVHGSQKWIPGSDPKDLDLGSYWIIDPDSQVCREIQWDHRSWLPYCRGTQWDHRS